MREKLTTLYELLNLETSSIDFSVNGKAYSLDLEKLRERRDAPLEACNEETKGNLDETFATPEVLSCSEPNHVLSSDQRSNKEIDIVFMFASPIV